MCMAPIVLFYLFCQKYIIKGMTDTTLVPQGSATRAQCAAMLMRFVEL